MSDTPVRPLDLDGYAQLRARLAASPERRAELLAERGYDEDSWDAVDDQWQAELSRALETDRDDLPAIVVRYSEAFGSAQRELTGSPLGLEQYARCLHAVQGARDPQLQLKRLGVSLSDFLAANQRWAALLAKDPVLAKRFRQLLSAG